MFPLVLNQMSVFVLYTLDLFMYPEHFNDFYLSISI